MNLNQPPKYDKCRMVMAFVVLFLAAVNLAAAIFLSIADKQNSSMFLLVSFLLVIFSAVVLTNEKINSTSAPWAEAIVKSISLLTKKKNKKRTINDG